MEGLIYLDNCATTKPCNRAIEAVNNAMLKNFGNPSSLYFAGLEAENLITQTRETLAETVCCRDDEIIFTSCGSESNNTAIFGAAKLMARKGKHIVTTSIEHSSVLEPIKALENSGYEITYIKPESDGSISKEKIENAIRPDTILVSTMYVNNETGAILPVLEIKNIIKNKKSTALFHIDCVQALGKIKIDLGALGADLASFSGHKIHGIKGAGALFVKKGIRLPAFILGGGQEKGMRSGTEAVPAIAAFGAALGELGNLNDEYKRASDLKNYLLEKLNSFDNVTVNSPKEALPYIVNFSFTGYRSETILHFLEQYGICVSSGSACSKGKGSYVLLEMGLEAKRVDSALRISFCRYNQKEDIDKLILALEGAKFLKKSGR